MTRTLHQSCSILNECYHRCVYSMHALRIDALWFKTEKRKHCGAHNRIWVFSPKCNVRRDYSISMNIIIFTLMQNYIWILIEFANGQLKWHMWQIIIIIIINERLCSMLVVHSWHLHFIFVIWWSIAMLSDCNRMILDFFYLERCSSILLTRCYRKLSIPIDWCYSCSSNCSKLLVIGMLTDLIFCRI